LYMQHAQQSLNSNEAPSSIKMAPTYNNTNIFYPHSPSTPNMNDLHLTDHDNNQDNQESYDMSDQLMILSPEELQTHQPGDQQSGLEDDLEHEDQQPADDDDEHDHHRQPGVQAVNHSSDVNSRKRKADENADESADEDADEDEDEDKYADEDENKDAKAAGAPADAAADGEDSDNERPDSPPMLGSEWFKALQDYLRSSLDVHLSREAAAAPDFLHSPYDQKSKIFVRSPKRIKFNVHVDLVQARVGQIIKTNRIISKKAIQKVENRKKQVSKELAGKIHAIQLLGHDVLNLADNLVHKQLVIEALEMARDEDKATKQAILDVKKLEEARRKQLREKYLHEIAKGAPIQHHDPLSFLYV